MSHEARGVATSTQQERNIIHGGRSQKLAALNHGQREHDAVFHLPKRSQLMHPDLDREMKPLQPKQAVRCGDPLLPQGRKYGPDKGDSAKINTEPSQEALKNGNDYEHCPGSKSGMTHRQPSFKELEAGGNCDKKEASSNARVGKKPMGGRSDDLDNAVRPKRVKSMRYDAGPPHGIGDYVGYVHDGVPHGKGTMEWPSGKRYTGEWNNGKRHGRGWHMWTDGRTFEGEWKDGKPHGMGKWTSPRGEAYDGELVRGKKCGKGTFTYVDGRKYIGEWLDGMRHGKGTRDYPDGSWYTGSWLKDKRHGWGEYTWRDGRVWAGQWREGNPVKARRKRLDSGVSPALVGLDLEEHDLSGTALDHPMEGEHEEQQQHVKGGMNTQEYRRQNSGRRGEGHPPPAPLPTRSRAAAEAIKEMRELKEFLSTSDKLRKPIVLVGDGEDTIERQGTASTQAGTMTASEWSGLSEPGGYGTNRGFVRQQGGVGLVKAQEKDTDEDARNAQHEERQQQRQASSKHKRLFGGAAEKFVQWGPSRVLTSVTRRKNSDSNSSGSQAQSQSKLKSQSQSQSQSQPQSQPQSQSQSQPQSQSQSQSQPQSQSQSQSQEGLGSRNDRIRDGSTTSEETSKDRQGGDGTRTSKRSERTLRRQTSGGDDLLITSMASKTSSTRAGHESPRDASHRREREKNRGDYGVGGSLFVDNGAPFEGSGLQSRPARSRIEVSHDHRSRRDKTVLLVDQARGTPSENSGDSGFGGNGNKNKNKNENVDDKVKNSIVNNTTTNKFGTHGLMNSKKTSLREVRTSDGNHGGRTTRGPVDPSVAATFASPSTVSLNSPTTTTRSLAEEDTTRSRVDSSETISGVRDADSRAVSPQSSRSTSRSDRCRNINRSKESPLNGSRSHSGSQAAVTYRRPVHRDIDIVVDMDYPSSPSSRHSHQSGPRFGPSASTARRTSLVEVRPTDEDTEGEVSDFDEPDQVMATRRTPRRVRRPSLTSGNQRERSNGDGFTGTGQRASTHRESDETCSPMNNNDGGLLDRKYEAQESTEYVKRAEGIRQIRAAALRSVKLSSTSRLAGRKYSSTQLSRRRGINRRSDTGADKYADAQSTQSMSDSNAKSGPSDRIPGHRRGSSREQSTGDEVMDMSFDAGFPHGIGSYSGEVKNGLPDGQGTMIWPAGERYKGEWQQGKRTGYGTFTWEGGRIHQGDWVNNKAHGEGTFWYGDGSSYVGGWTDGLKHGRGRRTYADRSIYDGEWQHGLRHGKARWCGSDGTYEGEYTNDVKSGKGTYTWSDGRKYSGSWRDGKMHGQGILYSKSGGVLLKGKWRRGEKTLFF